MSLLSAIRVIGVIRGLWICTTTAPPLRRILALPPARGLQAASASKLAQAKRLAYGLASGEAA
ncbi:MAG: hypothetical protein EXS31_15630 [Pedosphaera sp.]|nr:hypothetical protein [Pedosphaera sp.]